MKTVYFENTPYQMQEVKISFMNGNKDLDGLVYDTLCENYSQKDLLKCNINFDDAIYSNGFIDAIINGLVPNLELHSTVSNAGYLQDEYHHIFIGEKCFKMYFTEKN
jgi:hypothetical protein